MGLHRRTSSAAGKSARFDVDGAQATSPLAAQPQQQQQRWESNLHGTTGSSSASPKDDLSRWREEAMTSPTTGTVILPGFRGLWQSQGNVLMVFVFSLAALAWFVSLVSCLDPLRWWPL